MNKSTIKVLNKAIKETNGNEFKVLYYILNGKALGVEEEHNTQKGPVPMQTVWFKA